MCELTRSRKGKLVELHLRLAVQIVYFHFCRLQNVVWKAFLPEGDDGRQPARESVFEHVGNSLQRVPEGWQLVADVLCGRKGNRSQMEFHIKVTSRLRLLYSVFQFLNEREEPLGSSTGLFTETVFGNRNSHSLCELGSKSADFCPVSQSRQCSDDQRREFFQDPALSRGLQKLVF